eukprot:TRINITY_DN5745_c1_g2_i1.p2 TRINITY_DN5745_c1_g2~~TRINITY_DN5745_c1_g2_i1.p2  ORF type:complete len:200 (+),score=27.89 TRINITY_DN5745_c1_g2_i1:35-634(+)
MYQQQSYPNLICIFSRSILKQFKVFLKMQGGFFVIICLVLPEFVVLQGQIDNFKCGLEGSCLYRVCDEVRCAADNCGARQGNIQGDLLTLHVNSLSYSGGPGKPPTVTNPAGCCDQCKQTSGCNAWVFCSNKDGCGSGCDNYIKKFPGYNAQFGFGPFGSRCRGTKWPYLMCSLKTLPDVNNPKDTGAGDGWVSGVLMV